jgi:hypothetical protein
MSSALTSDIFFFITSAAVIILTIVFTISGVYVVRILKDFKEISEKIKTMTRVTEEEFENIHTVITESWLFKFIFGKKQPTKKQNNRKTNT